MEDLTTAGPVAFEDVDEFDVGHGKDVVDARLFLEERYGPQPYRRVVEIETADGATYRFQRYDVDEHLVQYGRENADGEEFTSKQPLPSEVEAVREAIQERDVLPDFEEFVAAETEVEHDVDDEPGGGKAERSLRIVTDGGERVAWCRMCKEDDDGHDAPIPESYLQDGLCPTHYARVRGTAGQRRRA